MPSLTEKSCDEECNIWIAAGDGNVEAVEEYLTNGGPGISSSDLGNPNVKDDMEYTPMHAAAAYGQIEMVEFLLAKGADLMITDGDGDTVLHITETAEMAQYLIEKGADPSKRNNDGFLPIESAQENEFDQVVEYLRQFTPDFRKSDVPTEDELRALVLENITSVMGGSNSLEE